MKFSTSAQAKLTSRSTPHSLLVGTPSLNQSLVRSDLEIVCALIEERVSEHICRARENILSTATLEPGTARKSLAIAEMTGNSFEYF